MAELTTDQRLSGALLPLIKEQGDMFRATHENARTLRESGEAANTAVVQEHLARNFGLMTDRLGELVEGLAAGRVRIVDERLLREVAESYIVLHCDGSTPAHLADLMFDELKSRGALR